MSHVFGWLRGFPEMGISVDLFVFSWVFLLRRLGCGIVKWCRNRRGPLRAAFLVLGKWVILKTLVRCRQR